MKHIYDWLMEWSHNSFNKSFHGLTDKAGNLDELYACDRVENQRKEVMSKKHIYDWLMEWLTEQIGNWDSLFHIWMQNQIRMIK